MDQYNNVTQIPDIVQGERVIKIEKKKISAVQNMQKKVTKQYTELMRFVSDECIEIMGNPPCKYSVVGLGSLARSEITLYSDFEHIILLEDEAAWSEERKTIMRYFKWFSTIFHIVLINLGETMIPSVAISSLNWFYDAFTPNGVAFDGMMSHASKIPLGRQPTVNKPWKMELIKPVKEMLQLLEKEQDIKQGYHLADILSKSCFVAGEETLFHEYQDKSHIVVARKDEISNFSMVMKQMDEDLQNLSFITSQVTMFLGLQSFNIKRVIYRSATIFLASIGRRYSIKQSSCFDIIDILEQRNLCSEKVAHELRFMVAVACEIRFKVYHSKGRQDDVFMEDSNLKSIVAGLVEMVEKGSFCFFMEIAVSLHYVLAVPLHEEFPLTLFPMDSVAWKYNSKMLVLYTLALKEEIKTEIRKMINFPSLLQKVQILFPLLTVYRIFEYALCSDLCEKIIPLDNHRHLLEKLQVRVLAFKCKLELGRWDRRNIQTEIEDMNKLIFLCENMTTLLNYETWLSLALREYSDCLLLVDQKDPSIVMIEKSLQYYEKFLQTPEGKCYPTHLKVDELVAISDRLVKNNQLDKAFHIMQKCLVMLKGYKQTTVLHANIYLEIAQCYFVFEQDFESFICWCEVVRIRNALNEPVEDAIKSRVQEIFYCLKQIYESQPSGFMST